MNEGLATTCRRVRWAAMAPRKPGAATLACAMGRGLVCTTEFLPPERAEASSTGRYAAGAPPTPGLGGGCLSVAPSWCSRSGTQHECRGLAYRGVLGEVTAKCDCLARSAAHTFTVFVGRRAPLGVVGFTCARSAGIEFGIQDCSTCAGVALWWLTFELSGRQRQDARPGRVKMDGVPLARSWWPAVGAPLERGVRPQR